MAEKFTESHKLMYYECDTTKKLTLPMLLNIIIKTSESQSRSLKRGSDFVKQFGLTWVITNYEIKINQLPQSEETITIATLPTSYNKFFCYRDFWVYDQAGNECVTVHATFVLMDRVKRKMTRVVPEIIEPYACERTNKINRSPKLLPIEKGAQVTYRVRYLDIDSNHHVNNSKYLDWMLDVLGYDFLTTHTPTAIQLKYEKEVAYGSEVESHWEIVQQDDVTFITKHQIKIATVLYTEANIYWKKIPTNG